MIIIVSENMVFFLSRTSSLLFRLPALLLLLLLPASAIAQRNITLGSVLTATANVSSSWASPSGDFAFGFREIQAGGFLLAIWFDQIPEKTVVWSENGSGNLVAQGSTLLFGRDGRLLLRDPNGQGEVWSSTLEGSGTAAYAAMLDNGNFVVVSQQGNNLWQSFNVPSDTLLPGQVLIQDTRLVARFSETNYSMGRFHLRMQTDGNLVLYTLDFPSLAQNSPYWPSNTFNIGYQLVFNQSGNVYVVSRNGTIVKSISTSSGSTNQLYQRAILDYDGVFRHYVYPRTSEGDGGRSPTWSVHKFEPSNICLSVNQDTGGGACGLNSYCILGDDQRPRCECPPGYSLLDPNDPMNGCKPDFVPQDCNGSEDANNFELRDKMNTDWPRSDYEHYQQVSEDWCRQACLADCFCAVAIFNNGDCWKKRNPLSNGRQDSSVDRRALIKVRKENSTGYRPGSGEGSNASERSSMILAGSLILGSSVFINILLLVAGVFTFSRLRKGRRIPHHIPTAPGMNLRSFTYQELADATGNFKEEIGKGAFATVYRGESNSDLIAVKKLHKMVTENEQEFQAEMSAIERTHHRNLVQLLGYCNEGEHRLLVYEYMSKGSLADYIFGESRLKWHQRIQIAFGVARGTAYLHDECNNQIIHCDIKPQNVLLDDSFNAKISDFGLAKLLKKDQTRTNTCIRGTRGYVAPEWFKSMPITAKVDVYSFGILLLELICCRKNFIQDAREEEMVLTDWACDCYEDQRMYLLVQTDEEAIEDMKMVEKLVKIAIWCIQDEPALRPSMKKVLQMLDGAVEVPPPQVLYSNLSVTEIP